MNDEKELYEIVLNFELYGSGIEWERDEEKGWFTLLKYDKPLSGSNAESTGPRCNEALKMNKGERELAR
ncbi:hypothetical protein TYRP_000110 [Tyrophagus putrescentiae]|nr:hypothetical protein TYRP_000110 [Tyrophagus putrescentiae]